MAISKQVENNNLLNAWARVMNEEPFIFNQVDGRGAPLNDQCNVYIQPEREDIARALDSAIKKMARVMHYWPRPKYFQDTSALGKGVPFWRQVGRTQQSGKLITFGTRGSTLIQPAVNVAYSDPGSIGVDTVATVTVPTSLTDPDEIQLFFQVADGALGAGDTRYQIEPVNVTISGGNAVITGDRALFVKPSTIWNVPYKPTDPNYRERNNGDTLTAADFVTEVDVYRIFTDTTSQIEILDVNNNVIGNYNAVIDDARMGLFMPEQSCEMFICSCRFPVRVRVNYLAGEALVFGNMDAELEEAIVRLSSVLMPEELCAFCQRTHDRFAQDRSPMVKENVATLTANDIKNQFGSVLQGAVYAYRVAVERALGTGGKLTRGRR